MGAEDEVRTRDPQLGRLMLYRLSYFRKIFFENFAGFSAAPRQCKPVSIALDLHENSANFLKRKARSFSVRAFVGEDGFEPPKV